MVAMTETDPRLTQKAQACTARVSKLEHQGQFYWVKREEKLSLRLRLQKGASASAFERERAALHQLAKLRAPVPAIVAEGPDFFVHPRSARPSMPSCAVAITRPRTSRPAPLRIPPKLWPICTHNTSVMAAQASRISAGKMGA